MIGALPGIIATRHASGITTVNDVAGLALDFNAHVGVSPGATFNWTDQKNSVVASQATADAQPAVQAGVLNGYDALRFNGSSTFLQGTATGQDDRTVFAVVRRNGGMTTENQTVFGEFQAAATSNRRAWGIQRSSAQLGNGGKMFYFSDPGASTFRLSTFVPADDTWYVFCWRTTLASTLVEFFANGIAASSSNSIGDPPNCDRIWIGKAGTSSGYLKGDIARIVVYDGALSESDRKLVENLLGTTTYNIHAAV